MEIKASDILTIKQEELKQYKLHLATWNGTEHPLNVYLESWDRWVGWNKWKGGKNDFSREYIFSLIQYYHEPNKWLFGGIFKVISRNGDSYGLELQPLHENLIGRLLIDFHRYQGMRGRAYYLENYLHKFTVSEILSEKYNGEKFPGYEQINIDFIDLAHIYKNQKNDWKTALQNIKGVYVIFDKSNGKKYVGSAYGDTGIWSRWNVYVNNGHGWNDELTQIINTHGLDYAKKNFRFVLLEYRPMRTDDSVIIDRESYWKEALLSRGVFGYNKN
jgi:hypothetical protein